ncbi:MAG: hypothetical protein HYS86_05070 [Candidatus Chisholmbacteria bacterium]|nr:hypothetical protein [Candidatus Chisholmbacteria bacterium]
MNFLKRFLGPILLYFSATTPVFAQEIAITKPSQVTFENLGSLIGGAVGLIIVVSLIITFFFLIIGGIKWITSGGDKAQVESARNQITNALIGLAIVAGAWAIMRLIGFFFGIDPFSLDIPTVSEQ